MKPIDRDTPKPDIKLGKWHNHRKTFATLKPIGFVWKDDSWQVECDYGNGMIGTVRPNELEPL